MNQIFHSSEVSAPYSGTGGKAEGLLFLERNGFNTPVFYLVPDSVVKYCLQQRILPEGVTDRWKDTYPIAKDSLWAVRSSAGAEDSSARSYAGLFRTLTNVAPSSIANAITEVISSYKQFQPADNNLSADGCSVIIQEMIQPEYAGVIFSQNPLDSNDKSIILNIIPGLGEDLVSGRESALKGIYADNRFTWVNRDEIFYGHHFDQKLNRVSATGDQIVAALQPCLKELIEGVKRLSELKKCPVDVEFATSNNKIYWLQVRPITALNSATPLLIYDNSNIGENYPGISMPLTISFVQYTYERAYTEMARYLGMSRSKLSMNTPLFKNMVGGIYGSLYYNITAWQQLAYQLPFGRKTSKHITKVLAMEPAGFDTPPGGRLLFFSYFKLLGKAVIAFLILGKHKRSYLANCEEVLRNYPAGVFKGRSHEELISIYHEMDGKLTSNWLAPVLNGFYAMILLLLLRKIIGKSRLNKEYPNFVNDILFSQGDIISVRIVRDFQQLIISIQRDEKLHAVFQQLSPGEVYDKIKTEFPEFLGEVNGYLNRFGERCDQGELKMETLNYRDDPVRFMALLKSNSSTQFQQHSILSDFNYHRIIKETYRHRPVWRYFILLLIKKTIRLVGDRENYRFVRTRIFSLVRELFREMDLTLYESKWIENKGDSLYLDHKEILNSNLCSDFKSIILKRKQEYENYFVMKHANRYIVTGKSITPCDKDDHSRSKAQYKGTGCCSGTVINRVRIVTPETMEGGDFSGYVLVGRYIEPGWINLFSQAAGIISEKGNLLSHTAILCRELGIPAIIGARGITSSVADGDLIRMDGSTGEIEILEHGK